MTFLICAAPASRPQVTSNATPPARAANYKPAPKRVSAEDIQRILSTKRPQPPVCNAVASSCNPIPQLTALSPSGNVAPGSAGFTLVVSGNDFVPGAVVQWDYNPLATTFVSSSQLTATVTPDLLSFPGVANIAVVNPTPGGGFSASLSLSIGPNPAPTVFFLFPFSVPVGTGDTTLFIGGSGFTDASVVTWNGQNLPTTFFDNTFISAIVPAKYLAQPGAAEFSVFTPLPGGGTLSPELFPVTIPLQTNDLAYDPQVGKLIASVPAGAGASGNGLRLIDPQTGAVSPAFFIGSEPVRVVVSDDGQFAYTGLTGSPSVARLNLNSLTPDLTFFLGPALSFGENVGPNYARDLAVVPGQPHSVIVSRKSIEIDPSSTGLAVFDDGVQRPNTTPELTGPITFGGSPSILFGFDDNDGGFTLSRYQIDPFGLSLLDFNSGLFHGFNTYLVYSGGPLYGSDGNVVDANTEALLGSFPLPAGAAQFDSVAPDAFSGVTSLLSQDFGFNVFFTAYDQASFQPLVSFPLTGITFPSFVNFDQPIIGSLVRWGSDGLAFRDIGGQVYITHSNLLVPPSGNPQPIANALSPVGVATGAAAFVLDLQGSNFVTGSTVNWKGSPRPTSFISSSELQAVISASDVAAAQIATITVTNPAPGGGLSGPLAFTVGNNPLPQLHGVSPNTIQANGPSFTLSVTGRGFVPGSAIAWNGSPLATFFDDSGHLHAPMFAPPVKGPNAVTVVNPAPGGGVSNKQIVNATNNNSVPSVFSISPESAAVGTNGIAVTVSGFNFTTDSTASWNGTGLGTSFVSPFQLSVAIPPALLANLGTGHIVVSNPAPGGGSSNETLFPVYLPLPFANDMVYEPFTRRLYLAMSDYIGGPTLLSVDPSTGARGTPVPLPGNPETLAVSDDGQFIYVGFNPQPLIARFNVATQSLDSQFVPACSFAFSLAVMPGHPHTIAAACNGVTGIYDDGALRPITFSAANGIIAFGSDSTLFMNSLGEPGSNIFRLAVDANGVALDASGNGAAPPIFAIGLTTAFGEVITPDGQVIDPSSLNVIGSLAGQSPDGIISVQADENIGRIFGGSRTFFGFVNSTAYAFDPFHYQPLASLNVPGPFGSVSVLPRLLRWGQDGIAFQGEAGFFGQTNLYSVESPSFVLPQSGSPNPLPGVSSLSPATVSAGSPNLRLRINGSNFMRGAVVSLNGSVRETVYVSATELIADVPAADLAKPGLLAITVANPAPGGGNSATSNLTVHW